MYELLVGHILRTLCPTHLIPRFNWQRHASQQSEVLSSIMYQPLKR